MSRFLDRIHAAARLRQYSVRTEEAYLAWIRRFIVFHGRRHPDRLRADDVARKPLGATPRRRLG